MSEVIERTDAAPETAPAQTNPPKKEKKPMSRKTKRRIVRWVIALVLLGAVGFGGWKYFGGRDQGEAEAITSTVEYGAITSTVEGSGLTKAKDSAALTISTPGTMTEVLVTEGQQVQQGDPLFVVDSPAARAAVEKARANVEGYEKQLNALYKDIAGLHLSPSYPGKLMECVTLNPGDTISKGQTVAKLNDDTKLRLEQYYSYAYEGDLYVGQEVEVSIPAMMTAITGTVEKVNLVSRITPEGSKLFSATILIDNEGALTADMTASATVTVDGEKVYPYEPGKLQYYRTGELQSTVSGTVISSKLVNYLSVQPGQVLVEIDGEDSEAEIFTLQQSLEGAMEELEKAQKNLDNCNATAPISGTIIGLTTAAGAEIDTQTPICTISDTSVLTISADVDERNISMIQVGDLVDLNQWETYGSGVVESVSLSSKLNNGVARYPIVIAAENPDGILQVNSYISYTLVASQNDNCLVVPVQCVRTVSAEDGTPTTVVYVKGDKPENALENAMADETIPEGYWPVPVELGIQDSVNVEIKSGVEQGMEVFTQMMENWG